MEKKLAKDFATTAEYAAYVAKRVAAHVAGFNAQQKAEYFNKSGGCWFKYEVKVGEDFRTEDFKLSFVKKANALSASRSFNTCFPCDMATISNTVAMTNVLTNIMESAEERERDYSEAKNDPEVAEMMRGYF